MSSSVFTSRPPGLIQNRIRPNPIKPGSTAPPSLPSPPPRRSPAAAASHLGEQVREREIEKARVARRREEEDSQFTGGGGDELNGLIPRAPRPSHPPPQTDPHPSAVADTRARGITWDPPVSGRGGSGGRGIFLLSGGWGEGIYCARVGPTSGIQTGARRW